MRRWPKEIDLAMTAGIPVQKTSDAQLCGKEWIFSAGIPVAVTKVVITVGGKEYEKPVTDGQTHVTFTIPLEKGNLDLKAQLVDETGRLSAYYAYVSKK